jgi:glutamate-1-semialdehyde 2,1-aminomutase
MNNMLVSFHPQQGSATESQPSCGGQPASEYAETIVLPWNDADQLQSLFELAGDQIAALIAEPLLANSGCCEPRDGFLQSIVDLCYECGAISIFDEVITGFRLAPGGAREYYDITPDLSVYGKALAGGFTLSAVAGRASMFDVLRDGRTIHSGTYNGNPICLAAALATLELLSDPDVFARMHAHGYALQKIIRETATDCQQQLSICGTGTVFSVHWGVAQPPADYRKTLRSDMDAYTRFRLLMLERGIYLLPDGRWYVGAAHDDAAVALAADAIRHCMRRMS